MAVTDRWFESLAAKINNSLKVFAASIFLLFTAGMVYGIYFYSFSAHPFVLFLPPLLVLLAYYSRDFALVVLVLSIIFFMV